jgi:hypothetical protein
LEGAILAGNGKSGNKTPGIKLGGGEEYYSIKSVFSQIHGNSKFLLNFDTLFLYFLEYEN